MKLYIQTPAIGGAVLVKAQPGPGGDEFRVWHPEAGYSVWPMDQFVDQHRALTRREAQLVNHSIAELEIMAISDNLEAVV